jgi:D-glycero-D-manno-heptose 1,7-bisphosphate phosphatase
VSTAPRRAVFLDRDGVVNRSVVTKGKPFPPADLGALEVLPGVPEALQDLRRAGYLNIVVTNQPDVRTGVQQRDVVDAMHASLLARLDLDAIETCFHVDADACECRKPKPGMLLAAASRYGIDLGTSFLVGDRWRDIGAAHAAGCSAFFIYYGYDERLPDEPYVVVDSLADAVNRILAGNPSSTKRSTEP